MSLHRVDPTKPIQGKVLKFWKDQFGRVYSASAEVKTGAAVGYKKPKGWSSPWRLPNEYLRDVPSETGENLVFADYQAIVDDILAAREQWEKDGDQAMRRRYKDQYKPDMALDEDIKKGLGPYPGPVEPWVACLHENPSALGWDVRTQTAYAGPVDQRLVPFLPVKDGQKVKVRQAIAHLDFSVPAEGPSLTDDLEARLDLEEQFDPDGIGGQPVPVVKRRGKAASQTPTPTRGAA